MSIITENSPRSEQPKNINISLKPHQLASLYSMIELDSTCGYTNDKFTMKSNIGILGDKPGYGKTITFLALIECLKERKVDWMPYLSSYGYYEYGIIKTLNREFSGKNVVKTTLIVAPDNLTNHWQRHIDNYTSLMYEKVTKNNFNKIIIDGYDIILCPASIYNKFVSQNLDCVWNRVAYDEIDSINIPNTGYVHSRFIWGITSTYENMKDKKNNGFLKDLFKHNWSKDKKISDTSFYNIVIKGSEDFVKKSFIIPEPTINVLECLTPDYVYAIKNHINSKTLEYINAGDMDNAILSLGGNVDTDRNIIALISRNIDNSIITIKSKITTLECLDLPINEKNEKKAQLEEKLLSLSTRKQSLEEAILQVKKTNCSICLDLFTLPTITPCCNNMFCVECLIYWMKNNDTCPMCRKQINIRELHTISDNENLCKKQKNNTDKLTCLLKIIKDNPNGKFLVFSGHSRTFKLVEEAFIKHNITYGILTTAKTENTLDKFKNGSISVILLNAENNGAGLEIPEATDVVLYHEMNKNLELQAISRAQRIGRTQPLQIWKLKYEHEYS
jgi:SNF2 family DNA or RNA helicase